MISPDRHRPNFQFLSENRGLGQGAFLGLIVCSVLNGELSASFASNLVCAHDFGVSLHLENRKFSYGPDLGPFGVLTLFGHQNYIISKLWNLLSIWFEIWQVFLWLYYLQGGSVVNAKFCPKMGLWKLGNFGSKKVRSVLNGAIFNCSASNLVCAHDFKISPPRTLKNSIWDRFGPFLGTDPFWANKIRRSHNYGTGRSCLQFVRLVLLMMYKILQCANFLFLSENGPMGMGQFWVPKSAVGPK